MTLLDLIHEAGLRLGRELLPDEQVVAARLEGRPDALELLLRACDRPPEPPDDALPTVGYVPTRVQVLKRGRVRTVPGARRIR